MPGERQPSVFLTDWFYRSCYITNKDAMNETFWESLITIRNESNKALEKSTN